MGNAIMIAKLFTLGYCLFINWSASSASLAFLLIFSLIFTAFGVLIPVIPQKTAKLVLILLSLGGCAVIQWFFPILLILVPLLILELIHLFQLDLRWGILLLVIQFPLSIFHDLLVIHGLVSGFCMSLLLLMVREYKLETLQKENDALSLDNDRLHIKIRRGEALKQQWTYTAQLEERNKIAQEIHDKVGHSISGSLMQLEAAKLLSASDPDKASSMLDRVIQTLREGLESIRVTLRNIKPPSEQMGINRLQLILDDFKMQHGLLTSLTYEGDISRISPVLWKIYLENITEGLTNILRHSNATQVSVSLHIMNRMVRLHMWDNGSVYNDLKKGLGLSGMEERLCSVDGKLIIDTSRGFSLSMLIPLKEE